VTENSTDSRSIIKPSNGSCYSVPRWLLAPMIMLSACGPSDAASSNDAQSQAQRPQTQRYAVAGISPGMTAIAVAEAAQRAGYRKTHEAAGADWRLTMELETSGRRFDLSAPRRGISEQEFTKGGERISVRYVAMPQGPVAWFVYYSAPRAVLSFSSANSEMIRRYGRGSYAHNGPNPWVQWCSRPVQTARECQDHSHLRLDESPNGVSLSTQDEEIRREQRRLLLQRSGASPTF